MQTSTFFNVCFVTTFSTFTHLNFSQQICNPPPKNSQTCDECGSLQLLVHNRRRREGKRRLLAFSFPLCCEASVFLSTEETSNPVFTRGGVTAGRVHANIKSLNAAQTESLSVLSAQCSVICLLHGHF